MEEEARKRGGSDDETAEVKRSRNQEVMAVDPEEDIVAWLSLDDEAMDELMKFLDADADGASTSSPSSGNNRVKFIENPYSSPLIFQSSCSYITINGNEESCGSSFSDWESSVMASIDVGGIMSNAGKASGSDEFCEWFQGGEGGAWGLEEVEEARGGVDGIDWNWEDVGLEWFLDGEGLF